MSEDLNIETAADAAAGSEGAAATQRGVTVEYDFTAVPGGEKLFDETGKIIAPPAQGRAYLRYSKIPTLNQALKTFQYR